MNKQITQDDVIYFVVTDRFFGRDKTSVEVADNKIHGGTLDGLLSKLDYLLELGVTAIWVTPVYENIPHVNESEPYHYYWPQDFGRLDARLLDGTELPTDPTLETFGEFVDRCEARGLKVVLDMVVNHAGYGAQSRFDGSWFNVGGSGPIKGELSGLPDFNHDNPEVLDFHLDLIDAWTERARVTNIRMDTVKHVEPKFWHWFRALIRGEKPDTHLIGEVLCEGKENIPELQLYQNYHDFDAIFDFPLCTALRSTLIFDQPLHTWLARPRLHDGEEMGVLDHDNPFKGGYRNPNALVTLLDNHDLQRRIMSHARTKHQGSGEGLAWAIRVTKLCLGALFTMRGVPQLYYGTEIGLEGWKSGGGDADLRRDFPWEVIGGDQRPRAEFAKEREVYEWTRELIKLRKGSEALKYGTTITLWADRFVYAFLRVAADDVVLVVINNGYEGMSVPVPLYLNPGVLPGRVREMVKELKRWGTGEAVEVEGEVVMVTVGGKGMEVFTAEG